VDLRGARVPILTYDEFVTAVSHRADAVENPIVQEFLTRYRDHSYQESGHFKQSYWASVLFFRDNPFAQDLIRGLPTNSAVDLANHTELLEDWRYFLSEHSGDRSRVLGFDLAVLYRGLPQSLGGAITTGGGAGYPLKIVLRLAADISP
jgi:hypothetical protein